MMKIYMGCLEEDFEALLKALSTWSYIFKQTWHPSTADLSPRTEDAANVTIFC